MGEVERGDKDTGERRGRGRARGDRNIEGREEAQGQLESVGTQA